MTTTNKQQFRDINPKTITLLELKGMHYDEMRQLSLRQQNVATLGKLISEKEKSEQDIDSYLDTKPTVEKPKTKVKK